MQEAKAAGGKRKTRSMSFSARRTYIPGDPVMKVGFVGLGRMGSGMAMRLLKAGHDVTVYNRTPERAGPLLDQGARMARRLPDACRGDAVITMLAGDEAVDEVAFTNDGLLRSLPPNGFHISMSTISVALAGKLAETHRQAGQRFVSAPVFGRPDAAMAGKLFILAAGPDEAVDECEPLFQAMGQKTLRVGDEPESANLVKLSGNFLIASMLEAMGEAMSLIGKAGIDRRHYAEILASTVLSGPIFATYIMPMAEQRFEPAGFAASLGEKDIRLALAAAETLHVPMPLASLLHDRLLTLVARGGERLDWSALGQLAAGDAGLVGSAT
jgi:3-hydroxyisobutyrate dehydrogenase-like beta-hydroxyacid dehydrogenase